MYLPEMLEHRKIVDIDLDAQTRRFFKLFE
jgi:hypothetical protein